MDIVGQSDLEKCMERYPDSETAIREWIVRVREASWRTPYDIRVGGSRVVRLRESRVLFKIMRNRYRIIVHIDYREQLVTILLAGSHAEYERFLRRMKRRL